MEYLIIYKFDKITPQDRVKFTRELYGYKNQSHKGKYVYTTPGAIQNYEKPVRSTIIVKQEKTLKKALSILKKYKAKTQVYKINPIKP